MRQILLTACSVLYCFTSSSQNGFSFGAPINFATGTTANYLVSADFNEDGKADIAVTNSGDNSVSVNIGLGNGTFNAPTFYPVGSLTGGIMAGDFNHDGHTDLVTFNLTGGPVNGSCSVLLGNGAGGFAAQLSINSGGTSPRSVAIGDWNGDTHLDIAVLNQVDNTLGIILGNGNGTFQPVVLTGTGSRPVFIATADFNKDGKADLAISNRFDNNLSILLGNGNGTFTNFTNLATGTEPFHIAIGDINNDDKPDLVVSNHVSNNVSVFTGSGTGSFLTQPLVTVGNGPFGITMADFDKNGKLDLVVTNENDKTLSTFSGNGNGSFSVNGTYSFASGMNTVITADFNNDSRIDIGMSSPSGSVGAVMLNQALPVITSFSPVSGAVGTAVTISGSDFNVTPTNNIVYFGAVKAIVTGGNSSSLNVNLPAGATYQPVSVLDIATGLTAYSSRPFITTFSNPSGSGIPANYYQPKVDFVSGNTPFSVAMGDVNGDGKPDMLIANNGANTISVFRNISSSGSVTTASFATKVDFATASGPYAVACGDINGDGKPDLVVTNYTANSISVFQNTSSAGTIDASSFAAKVDFSTGTNPRGVAIGDVNGDGRPDIVVTNFSSNTVSVFRNTSVSSGSINASSFAAKVDFATGSLPISVAIGDIDGNGKPELVVANYTSGTISVFRNTSNSLNIDATSFAAKVDFGTGSSPYAVAIGDVDGDGKPELVNANKGSNTISVFRNTSSSGTIDVSSFAAKTDFVTGGDPVSVAMGDLDGDGKVDVAVANSNAASNTVSVFRNTSSSGTINSSSLASKIDFGVGGEPIAVATCDVEGDGIPELVVANYGPSTVSVLKSIVPSTAIADLSSLVVSAGTLTPVFAPATISYTDEVLNNVLSITVAPTSLNPAATIKVNGSTVVSGNVSSPISLIVGSNPVSIEVTSQDGTTIKTYTINVTRLPANNAPTISSFSPASGPVNTVVTITGTNLNAAPLNNIVYFGAVKGTVNTASTTSLTVTVPAGATYQPISVLNSSASLTGYSSKPFAATFTNPFGVGIPADFYRPKVDFSAGTNPRCLAIADVDGDGKPDIIVANRNSNTVSVFRNISSNGNISTSSFAPKVDFTTGTGPFCVVTGDLDGDGKPDLAVANYNANTISLLRNISTPGSITASSFELKVDFNTGNSPYSVAIADLDKDGKADLAAANYGSNTISVLRNTTTTGSFTASSFAAKVDFNTAVNPWVIVVADIDGDSNPDLVAGNYGSGSVSILRNTSNTGIISASSFASNVDFNTGINLNSVAVGDIDGDGKPDLVAAVNTKVLSVFRNVSSSGSINSSSLAAKVDFTLGSIPEHVILGDVDGDGKADVIIASNVGDNISIFRNVSAAGIINASSFAAGVTFTTGSGAVSIAAGDLDGDGISELANANYNTNTISVFKISAPPPPTVTSFSPTVAAAGATVTITGTNLTGATSVSFGGTAATSFNVVSSTSITAVVPPGASCGPIAVTTPGGVASGTGFTFISQDFSFGAPSTFTTGNITPTFMATADFNEDNKADAVIANRDNNNVSVLIGAGNGSFSSITNFAVGSMPHSVAVGDLNHDGHMDIVTANLTGGPGNGSISVLLGNGAGGFSAQNTFSTAGTSPRVVTLGDWNGDNHLDAAVVNQVSNTVAILLGNGTGGFGAASLVSVGSRPVFIISADVNHDNKPDLLVTHRFGNTVSILFNDGAGNFTFYSSFDTGSEPFEIASGDINNDGNIDLAVSNNVSNNVSIFFGTAAGSFVAKPLVSVGVGPRGLVLADFNNDNKLDLAVSNVGSGSPSTIYLFKGDGTGNFCSHDIFNITNQGGYLIQGDFNNDSKKDIAMTFSNDGGAVMLNNFAPAPSNANLLNLVLSAGVLAPVFTAADTTYTTDVVNTVTSIAVTPTAVNPAATIKVNGLTLSSGNTSPPIPLSEGSNAIIIAVTAADGITIKKYTINVTRLPASTALTITSFTPVSGAVGTTVTIAGTNFSANPANNVVYFGAVKAVVSAATSTSLTVTVPIGATYLPITVTSNNLTAYSSKPFVITFSGTGGPFTAASFSAKVDFVTGSFPASIASGDLDGDGKPDLVTANKNSGNISVLKNIATPGNLGFAPKVDYASGSEPFFITMGDIDGDGKLDVAVVHQVSSTVSIFRNTSVPGTVSFAAKVDYNTGSTPLSVSICDLDGDGKPDVSIADYGTSTVSIFRNTSVPGTISFLPKITLVTGNAPWSITSRDFDGDGKPDLAVSTIFTGAVPAVVSVFRNKSIPGDISFESKIDFTTGNYPLNLSTGDLDGDGKLDIAVANKASNTVSILKNISTPGVVNFLSKVDYSTGSDPSCVTIGDLNGDAKPDVAVSNRQQANFSLYRNISSLNNSQLEAQVNYAATGNARSIVVCDLDGDGRPDVAESDEASTVSVFRNVVPVVSPASLSNLVLSKGTLAPVFESGILNYSALVINSISTVTVTPTSVNAAASIKVNGTAVLSGNASSPITLVVGNNNIAVEITAPDGITIQTYNVVVTRQPFRPPLNHLVISMVNGEGATACGPGNLLDAIEIFNPTSTPVALNGFSVQYGGGLSTSGVCEVTNLPNFLLQPGQYFLVVEFGPCAVTATSPSTDQAGNISLATEGGKVFLVNNTSPLQIGGSGCAVNSAGIIDFVGYGTLSTCNCYEGSGPTKGPQTRRNRSGCTDTDDNQADFTFQPVNNVRNSSSSFNICIPTITSFTPVTAGSGTTVTISGTNFTEAASVAFGGVLAESFNVVSSSSITAVVGEGSCGSVEVTTTNGTASLAGFTFISHDFPLSSQIDFTVGSGALYSASADFNEDGKADLATANATANNIAINLNLGNGVLGIPTFIPVGSIPDKICIGDINHDGHADVVVTNLTGGPVNGSISILLGNGTGGFAAQSAVSSGGTSPIAITLGDWNGDTHLDIAVLNQVSNTLGIILGKGDGTFYPVTVQSLGDRPWHIETGDFNKDGKADLAVSNRFSNKVTILLGNGAGQFTVLTELVAGSEPRRIAVADINNDGNIDLAVANSDRISIFLGTGTGFFVSQPPIVVNSADGILLADFNSDNKVDLAIAVVPDKKIQLYKGDGSGLFCSYDIYVTDKQPVELVKGYFNSDSNWDIATTFANDAAGAVLLNNFVNHAPVINPQTFTINENSANGVVVGAVVASDLDAAQTLTYTITAGNTGGAFTFVGNSLRVANTAALDFETTPTFSLTIKVMDNGSPNLSSLATVTVNLNNIIEAITFSGKVYLQGAYNTTSGTMDNTLNASGVLQANATAQPYNIAPFNYSGAETVGAGFFAAHPNIVDWILLELRNASTPLSIVARRAAFVKQDGTLIDTGGVTNVVNFPAVATGNYYVAIRHRNHLAVRSASLIDFTSGAGNYDFTTGAGKGYQNQSYTTTVQVGSIWAMRGGDANLNGSTKYSGPSNDQNQILNIKLGGSLSNILNNVYTPEDLNMDGIVKYNGPGNDQNFLLNIILGGLLSAIFNEQL